MPQPRETQDTTPSQPAQDKGQFAVNTSIEIPKFTPVIKAIGIAAASFTDTQIQRLHPEGIPPGRASGEGFLTTMEDFLTATSQRYAKGPMHAQIGYAPPIKETEIRVVEAEDVRDALMTTLIQGVHIGTQTDKSYAQRRTEIQRHATTIHHYVLDHIRTSDRKNWSVNFETRVDMWAFMRFLTESLTQVREKLKATHHEFFNMFFETVSDLEDDIRQERPPEIPEESAKRDDALRFRVPQESLPRMSSRDTGAAPSRSQVKGHGLPGRMK